MLTFLVLLLRSPRRRRLDLRFAPIDGIARSWVGHRTPALFAT
jgi:hypothetical protein